MYMHAWYVHTYVASCVHIILFIQGINLDSINVTLVPVPGQPYVYKASVESINTDEVSVLRATSGISSFIIRVSTMENNLTTYNLLVGWMDQVYANILNYYYHCLA